jgi:Na+-translocating ferredoxin:NAD+ oxidoreductase RnfA subunit
MSSHRVVLAVVLGLCSFVVASVSDEMLAARSQGLPVTFVIMGAYLALCQFLVAKKGVEPGANRATLLGMAAPPVLMFFVGTLAFESREVFLSQGIPGLLAGCLGPVVGAIAAWALPKKALQT